MRTLIIKSAFWQLMTKYIINNLTKYIINNLPPNESSPKLLAFIFLLISLLACILHSVIACKTLHFLLLCPVLVLVMRCYLTRIVSQLLYLRAKQSLPFFVCYHHGLTIFASCVAYEIAEIDHTCYPFLCASKRQIIVGVNYSLACNWRNYISTNYTSELMNQN